jgi:orotate phosphoribosyltransferase
MKDRAYKVSLTKNPKISVKVIPGHYATNSAHINNYLDVSPLKSNALVARDVARELAIPYLSSSLVETIVCMENTKVIGAFIAEELLQHGMSVMNSESEINVVTPLNNTSGKMIFFDSEIKLITNRKILLLVATISSGKTVNNTLECLEYYGGELAGISTLFLASDLNLDLEVNTLFTAEDIHDYKIYNPSECELCKAGVKVNAIISSEGYKKISS